MKFKEFKDRVKVKINELFYQTNKNEVQTSRNST